MADYIRLTDYATMSNDPRIAKIIETGYFEGSIIMRDVPFATIATMKVNGARDSGVYPEVTWMDINDTNIPSHSTEVEQYSEQAFLVREHIETDMAIVKDQNQIVNPHARNITKFVRAFSYDTNDKLFNNNHTTGNAKSFVGFKARLDNPSTFGTLSANKVNGGGVDMTAAAGTAKTFGNFIEILSDALWRVGSPMGDGVVLYMNRKLIDRISNFAAQFAGQGGFSQATDQLGRTVTKFRNAELRDPGMTADGSDIIPTVESAAGASTGATFTSVYAARYGEDGVQGWTHLPMDIRPIADPSGAFKRDLFEWMGGIQIPDPRAILRVYNIKYS